MAMWKDFKAFAFQGNVIDLAIAIVIGAAFTKLVTTVVDAVIMPIVGKLMPGGSYTTWAPHGIKLGVLIGAMIDFMIVAFFLFLVVHMIKRARSRY
jgi:large conductance mechanosensitive channel